MKNNWLLIIICFVFGNGQIYGQCACCAGAGIGSSNGDAGTGLLNIPKKTGIAELYGDYRSIQTGEHIHQHGDDDESILESMAIGLVGVRYGISRRVTIGALLPYVFLQSETGNDRGLGDMILQGTFGVWRKSQFEGASQAGLELPTGIRKSSNFDNTTVVVGSGSWDPMLGIILSRDWSRWALQAGSNFKYTTPGFEKNYYGSLSTHNLNVSYRIKGQRGFCRMNETGEPTPEPLIWTVFGGYYGEWLDRIKEDGVTDEDSGHYLGFVTTGTSISFQRWSIPLYFSVPVVQKLNGEQNQAGFRLRVGIIRAF